MTLKQLTYLIAISFCIAACTNTKEEIQIPTTVLSKTKMAEVFINMHIYEAAININTLNNASQGGFTTLRNWDFLKTQNITYAQFNESFKFYASHPELLNDVYQLALEELSKKQAQMLKPSK